MPADRFSELARGAGCPLCAPRPDSNDEWDLVAPLAASALYLMRDQTYRGRCVLVLDLRHVARLDQLTAEEWSAVAVDLHRAQRAVVRTVTPDHVNVESLGNVVPHLHWHIIPRYRHDPKWGDPIWGSGAQAPVFLAGDDRRALLVRLRHALAENLK
jgi:diadenosine tetraphosphate (Ap4A) HIT family hydrolase